MGLHIVKRPGEDKGRFRINNIGLYTGFSDIKLAFAGYGLLIPVILERDIADLKLGGAAVADVFAVRGKR